MSTSKLEKLDISDLILPLSPDQYHKGVQSSRGSLILFADADGASKFEDICKLEEALKDKVKYDYFKEPNMVENCHSIAIGSRAHLEKESLAKRSIF
ncbi:hypothetical protein evm_015389, partial [Chilo suppressalis]